MKNILILYDSATGNTKKMANYVAEAAAKNININVVVKSVEEANKNDVAAADGIALGSPVNMGLVSWKMKKFWDELGKDLWGKINGKIGCAFASQGGIGGGAEITCMSLLTILMNYGFLVFGITDYVADKYTLHYGATVAGEPREKKEIDACIRLGERLAEQVCRYEIRNLTESKN